MVLTSKCIARESLKFGFISPTDGPYGYRTSAAATTMAIEKAKRDGLWQDVDVTYVKWAIKWCRLIIGVFRKLDMPLTKS